MERCPFDLDKQLRILKDFYSNTGMTVTIDKNKATIMVQVGLTATNPIQHFQDLQAPTLSSTAKFSLMAKFCSKYYLPSIFPPQSSF